MRNLAASAFGSVFSIEYFLKGLFVLSNVKIGILYFCVTRCGTIVGYWKVKSLNFEVRWTCDDSNFFGMKITYEFNNFHANDK